MRPIHFCSGIIANISECLDSLRGKKVAPETDVRCIEVGIASKEDSRRNNKIKTSKYSLLTFIPKNFSEQFRRVANFYFLVVTFIAIFIDSPVSPMTSIAPLAFMVTVTAAKQGYEDWLRHRADNLVNKQVVEVIRGGTIVEVHSMDVSPGSLVRVGRGRDVPADLVLLCSGDATGKCYVTTANLDGETNLKPLRVPAPLVGYSPDILPKGMKFEVPNPLADLYTFYGRLDIPGRESVPLATENLMLRGSRVKNTEWAIGCAVYTGEETKLALNSRYMGNKFTSCEASVNKFLLFFITIMVIEMIISYLIKLFLEQNMMEHEYYLGPRASLSLASAIQDLFSFLLLYYYIVPISLYVTIELYKFIGSLFIGWDNDLKCPETGQPAVANTSDLNEELGQVEILFSDKTGTLTKNIMVFKMCSINGIIYEERDGKLYDASAWDEPETLFKADIKLFFTILALCHSVKISDEDMKRLSARLSTSGDLLGLFNKKRKRKKNGIISHQPIEVFEESLTKESSFEYQAISPDEKALVEAADRAGVTFVGEDGNNFIIKIGDGMPEFYERMQVLEFTSERKRMSIIVKDKEGKIWLFCKGAESSVLPLCIENPLAEKINKDVDTFASKGLRTLVVAYRQIGEEEYHNVTQVFTKWRATSASNSLRELTQQYRILENGLTLIGATAVEDCLQDDVAETLTSLRNAGISVWVLTGDKVETAINVAQSCAHIPDENKKMFLVNIKDEESLRNQLVHCKSVLAESSVDLMTLVVDGTTMTQVLGTSAEELFTDISLKCSAVLCCRLSPLQKAEIVKLIKNSPNRPITAAIGDGANDISMIQEAHIGFGIFGKEGRQAARSADFAFTKFSMINKILIVLGHWYYQRLAILVQYFFYKNLVFVNLMLFFQINSAFSTQAIFDSMYLTFFNLTFAALPCLVHSVTEQCRSARTLLREPMWYKKNRRNRLMSWNNFFVWSGLGVYHSILIYTFCYIMFRIPLLSSDGNTVDLWSYGAMLFHMLVVIVNLKLWLHTRYVTLPFVVSVFISIAAFLLFNTIYSVINISVDGDLLGTYPRLLSSLAFWIANVFFVVAVLLPDFTIRLFHDIFLRRRLNAADKKEPNNINSYVTASTRF